MASAIERFEREAAAAGLALEIARFPQGTKTAADAARAIGCDIGQIVKSLVFVADGRPFLALTSGSNRADLDYTGSIMPPPEAVAGTYAAPDGKKIKVAPLSDDDRLTLVRWIDLGCPIDLDHDAAHPAGRGYGWMCDDNRPTLTLTSPWAGANEPLTRLLVGMHDYYTGLDMDSFRVVADFPVDGAAAGEDLAARFKPKTLGVWELKLDKPIGTLPAGKITVSVKDRQGNVSRIERSFSIVTKGAAR